MGLAQLVASIVGIKTRILVVFNGTNINPFKKLN